MGHDEQQHAFLAFIANLISEADRYFGREGSDPVRDRIGYRMSGLWLSDQELQEFYGDLVYCWGRASQTFPRRAASGGYSRGSHCWPPRRRGVMNADRPGALV